MHIVEDIKKIKSKYGSTYFEKKGLHAVLNDLSTNIDKRFVSVLKKADELSLPEKLKKLRNEEDSIQALQVSNLRQDFVENTGLEPKMAALAFDVYLFGLGLKQDLNPLDYKATQVGNGIQLNELIELALADKRLEKNEMANIFNKGKSLGLKENEIFDALFQCIKKYNLSPLPYSDGIQPNNKETLLKYDWVDESIIKEEHKKAKDIDIDKEREQRRLLAIQKEQALADQKEKELEIKKIELELKKKEQEANEKAEQRKIELEKRKEAELRKRRRAQSFNSFLKWFSKNDDGDGAPLFWIFIIIFFGALIFFGVSKYNDRDNKLKDAQELSYKLEKKYELVKMMISKGEIDSASVFLQDLVHPSNASSEYKKEGFMKGTYKYNEYWQLKREEIGEKILELQGLKNNELPKIKSEKKINDTNKSASFIEFKEAVIGNQIWMTENLNINFFQNGDLIPQAKTLEEWEEAGNSKTPAWCYYNFDSSNEKKYGKLYNWYAVGDSRGLAPEGWRIPSDEDWELLSYNLGYPDEYANKIKAKKGWHLGNGTNSTGFSGLPGGFIENTGFGGLGTDAYWWSSTIDSYTGYFIWVWSLNYQDDRLGRSKANKWEGFSIRCIKK